MANQLQQTDERLAALQRYVGQRTGNLKTILPPNMNADRMRLVAMSAVSRNPKLLECSPDSFMLQLYVAAELGLEAGGVLGHFYLIPRGGEVTGMVGFKGYIEIAIRERLAKSIRAECIYSGEQFEYDRGTQTIHHPYSLSVKKDEKSIIGAYAIAEPHNGGRAISVLDRNDLDKRKAKAQTKNVWNDWPKEMCMKSAIRDLFNRGKLSIPAHGGMSRALEAEIDFEEGRQPVIQPTPEIVEVAKSNSKGKGNQALKDKLKGGKASPESKRVDLLAKLMTKHGMGPADVLGVAQRALSSPDEFTLEDYRTMDDKQRAQVAGQLAEEAGK